MTGVKVEVGLEPGLLGEVGFELLLPQARGQRPRETKANMERTRFIQQILTVSLNGKRMMWEGEDEFKAIGVI